MIAMIIKITSEQSGMTNNEDIGPLETSQGEINLQLLQELKTQVGTLNNKLDTITPWNPAPPWILGKHIIYNIESPDISYRDGIEKCHQEGAHLLTPVDLPKLNTPTHTDHSAENKYIIETRKAKYLNGQTPRERGKWAKEPSKCKAATISAEGRVSYYPISCTQTATVICVKQTNLVQEDVEYAQQITAIKALVKHLQSTANPTLTQASTIMILNPQWPQHPMATNVWTDILQAAIDETKVVIDAIPQYPTILQALTSITGMQAQVSEIAILAATQQLTYMATTIQTTGETIQHLAAQDIVKAQKQGEDTQHNGEEAQHSDTNQQITQIGEDIIKIKGKQSINKGLITILQNQQRLMPDHNSILADIQALKTQMREIPSSQKFQEWEILISRIKRAKSPSEITKIKTPETGTALTLLAQIQSNTNKIDNMGQCSSCSTLIIAMIISALSTIIVVVIPALCEYRRILRKLRNIRSHLELTPLDPSKAILPNLVDRVEELERTQVVHTTIINAKFEESKTQRESFSSNKGPKRRN